MEYKLNLITPSIYSESGLENCNDELSDNFAVYLKNRADNEFNTPCKYDKVPGLAFIHDFNEFEERFLVHSEYAVIIASPYSQLAIQKFLPRLLVFLTSRSIWKNRFLFLVIGEAQVTNTLVKHEPIKFSLDAWRTYDELSWMKLFDLVKVKWTPYIDEELVQSRQTPNRNPCDNNNVKKTVNVAIQGSSVVADSCYYFREDTKQNTSRDASRDASSNTDVTEDAKMKDVHNGNNVEGVNYLEDGAKTGGHEKGSKYINNSRNVVSEIIDDFRDMEMDDLYLRSVENEVSVAIGSLEALGHKKEAVVSSIRDTDVKETVDVSTADDDVKLVETEMPTDHSGDKKQEDAAVKEKFIDVSSVNAEVTNSATGPGKINFKLNTRGKPRSSLASPTGLIQIALDSKASLLNADSTSTDSLSHGMKTEVNIVHRGNEDFISGTTNDSYYTWYLSFSARMSSIRSRVLSVFRISSFLNLRSIFKRADKDIKNDELASVSLKHRLATWSQDPYVIAAIFVIATLLSPFAVGIIKNISFYPRMSVGVINSLFANAVLVPLLLPINVEASNPMEVKIRNPLKILPPFKNNNVVFHMAQ